MYKVTISRSFNVNPLNKEVVAVFDYNNSSFKEVYYRTVRQLKDVMRNVPRIRYSAMIEKDGKYHGLISIASLYIGSHIETCMHYISPDRETAICLKD